MARGWKHNPSPTVFPRPNPPRVGKGKATGFLRVLQAEIDRTLKKVQEGVDYFDEIWEKGAPLPRTGLCQTASAMPS